MDNPTEEPTFHSQPVPSVQGEAAKQPSKEAEEAPSKLKERAKSFGAGALEFTGTYVASPLIKGLSASAGALLAYAAGKKLGWL